MLTSPQPSRPRRSPQRSLKQEYGEFILMRIEEFKQQISREDLLRIADEAVRELDAGSGEQLVLTEVLVLEHVDRLIMRRLSLPTYRRWRTRHVKLRQAQRQPTHWGLDPKTPLVDLAARPEREGGALVAGAGAVAAALFLAAHDWSVVFLDPEVTIVDAAETRAAAEGLALRFETFAVSLGSWFPDGVHPALAVVDPVTIGRLDAPDREQFVETLKQRTVRGGVHCLLAEDQPGGVIAFAPEALRGHYTDWQVDRSRGGGSRAFVALKP